MAQRTNAADWLKKHAAGEKALARDLAKHFDSQADFIARELADAKQPSPSVAAKLLDEKKELKLLLDIAVPHAIALASDGALRTLKQYQKSAAGLWLKADGAAELLAYDPKAKRTFEDYIPDDLPELIKDAILDFVGELEKQSYWAAIEAATSEQISMIVASGLEDGLNGHDMAKAIRAALGGDASMARARAIARTETTGSMNAGHQAGYEQLAEDGLIAGKTWIATDDNVTRESHGELNDVTVGADEDFDVGGSPAPYPGHFSLPPEERVNCRCTTIAAIPDA